VATGASLLFFRIRNGQYSGGADHGTELADRDAAWAEITKVYGDLIGSLTPNSRENAEWQMELLDESKKPLFRSVLWLRTWIKEYNPRSAHNLLPAAFLVVLNQFAPNSFAERSEIVDAN
jgi:hypothetical protein